MTTELMLEEMVLVVKMDTGNACLDHGDHGDGEIRTESFRGNNKYNKIKNSHICQWLQ